MEGKVCLITGANSGIGKETAVGLAQRGATVIMVCRSRERGAAAQEEIIRRTGNDNVDLLLADLSVQAEIRQLAATVQERYRQLDVLINNAAIVTRERQETADGLEMQFAVNHLAYFLLTNLLLDFLHARASPSAPARIINVASNAHRWGEIDFDDLQGEKSYSGWRAYCQSKLANLLFTFELAQRLEPAPVGRESSSVRRESSSESEASPVSKASPVTVNALHPGRIATNLMRSAPGWLQIIINLIFRGPEKGAETPVYLATSDEVAGMTGQYFVKKKPKVAAWRAYDTEVGQQLWRVSAELTGLATELEEA